MPNHSAMATQVRAAGETIQSGPGNRVTLEAANNEAMPKSGRQPGGADAQATPQWDFDDWPPIWTAHKTPLCLLQTTS